jgi:endonuclease/exonuclease/phosphatase (EEP) superfamily protein YafD
MNDWRTRTAWILVAGPGGLSLAALLIGQAGRWVPVLDVANHFAPFWLVGGLLAAGASLAVAGPWKRLAVAISLGAILGGASLVTPVWAAAARQSVAARRVSPDAPRLKFIQFSFYHGNRTPDADVRWLLAQQADVVVLQETEGLNASARSRLLAAYPHQSTDGAYILSRYSLLDRNGFENMPRMRSMAYRGGYAVVAGPNGPFTVVSVHLGWPWSMNVRVQARELERYFATLPHGGTVVTGDFNATPWSFALRELESGMGLRRITHGIPTFPARPYDGESAGNPVRTLPGDLAYLAIDNIFAGASWRPISVVRGPRLGSDHYPVVATLAWSPE